MNVWEILGIDPTVDAGTIKRAYAAKLKLYHPEDDSAGFQRLRQAYEQALKEAKYIKEVKVPEPFAAAAAVEPGDTPVENAKRVPHAAAGESSVQGSPAEIAERFIQDIQAVYEDFFQRIEPACWEELLDRDALWSLAVKDAAGKKLLNFLMDHWHLPHEIWALLNNHFFWTDQETELYDTYPEDFINHVLNRVYLSWGPRYQGFPQDQPRDYAAFVEYREAAWQRLINDDLEQGLEFLQKAREIYEDDPDLIRLFGLFFSRSGDWDNALAANNHLTQACPGEPDGFLGRAAILMKQKDYGRALQDYQRVAGAMPDHIQALEGVARCYEALDNAREAKALFEQLIELSPYDIGTRMRLLKVNMRLVNDLQAELEAQPQQQAEVLLQIAELYFELKMYPECLEVMTRMQDGGHVSSDLYLLWGRVWEEKEEYKKAILCFDKALDLAGREGANGYAILVRRGMVLLIEERTEQAIRDLSAAVKMNPLNAEALRFLAEAHRMSDQPEQAIPLATEAIRINPDRWANYLTRGSAYYDLKRYSEAVRDYEKVVKYNYDASEFWYLKAYCHLELDQLEETREAFERGGEWEEEMAPDARFYYALTLFRLDHIDEAREEILAYRETNDDEERHLLAIDEDGYMDDSEKAQKRHLLLGDIYRAKEDWIKAGEEYYAGTLLAPDDFIFWQMAGYCFLRQENFEQAQRYFECACQLDKENPWAMLHLIWLDMRLGDWKKAERHLQQYLTMLERMDCQLGLTEVVYCGRIAYHRGYYEEAAEHFELACQHGAGRQVWSDLSLVYYELDEMEKALAFAKMALEAEPGNIDYRTRYDGLSAAPGRKKTWRLFNSKPSSLKLWPATSPMELDLDPASKLSISIGGE